MIRVGFVLSHVDRNWTGGLNYLNNLLHAIVAIPDRAIHPVLFAPGQHGRLAVPPSAVEIVRISLPKETLGRRAIRKAEHYLAGTDVKLQRLMRANGIDVISHSGHLGPRGGIPSIGWIPDFQHRRRPEFFSKAERAARDRGYRALAKNSTIVLLSSEDARRDLEVFYPQAMAKSEVLRFSSGLSDFTNATAITALLRKYDISLPYFYLPNQFWAHKNHTVVIDALARLKAKGRSIAVICTGQTADRRAPGYFSQLMSRAAQVGVGEEFRVLGLVPYEDVTGLMLNAASVLNPSLFEGWSTTVEEAKAAGCHLILSDIPVHREQAPRSCIYFPATDAAMLADALEQRLSSHVDSSETPGATAAARRAAFIRFGLEYQRIVLKAASESDVTSPRHTMAAYR